ncbi:MAG TPA: hypothetical protein VHR47_11315 [Bacillota bacterium]|nr:hypothetical protein [Bacillota bacterium]
MKKAIFTLLIVWLLSNCLVLAEERYYQERTGEKTVQTRLSINHMNNLVTIEYVKQNELHNVICQSNYGTNVWTYKNTDEQSNITLERVGDVIQAKGSLKDKYMQRTITIDGSPWYQFVSVSLADFLDSPQKATTFWTIQPSNLRAYKMSAKKYNPEFIEVHGEKIKAQHVKVSLTGILSVFWKVDYWFRCDDHVFVKFIGVNGAPGSPRTFIELASK